MTNPYAPGAGTPPPELAGRDGILSEADVAIQRNRACRPARSLMLVGLRGVGKTVLLNEMVQIAEKRGAISNFFEVGTNGPLAHTVITTLRAALLRLDRGGISGSVKRGLRVLKSFAAAVRIRYGDLDISIPDLDVEMGVADSGVLAHDLADLFVAVGEAAQAQRTSVVILIDEIQNLVKEEIGALIMAIHHTDRQQLPILVIGAGLPSMIRLSSESRSYAERLFEYSDVGPLGEAAIHRALVEPARRAGVAFDDAVIAAVANRTGGYPYFLQEWGYQLWRTASRSPVTQDDLAIAEDAVMKRLDRGFFRSRLERLTHPEQRYLQAMAGLGPGPSYRSGDIAKAMGRKTSQLGPVREALITKGMIYSTGYGYAAFTVPLFDGFLRRTGNEQPDPE